MRDAMGLIGVYNASNIRSNVSSVYMISDASTSSLFVFVLFPGAYHDVYEIASLTMYQNVFLIPISIYPEYISDLYRLVVELTKIKTRVKIISPDMIVPSIKTKLNTIFLNALVKGSTKSTYVYSDNGFISFDWNDGEGGAAPSTMIWPESFHDIYCTFGDKRILLTINKVDVDRIKTMLKDDLVDFVYIPWQNPSYTNTMFSSFIDVFNEVAKMDTIYGTQHALKLVIYGFPNDAAIDFASETYSANFPINARALFLSDAPVVDPWIESMTYGNAVGIATADYHLTPAYCCCGDPKYRPVWPRPYNPMMYAPPAPPLAPTPCSHCHGCHAHPKGRDIYICPCCGETVIIETITTQYIDGAYQETGDNIVDDDNTTNTDNNSEEDTETNTNESPETIGG